MDRRLSPRVLAAFLISFCGISFAQNGDTPKLSLSKSDAVLLAGFTDGTGTRWEAGLRQALWAALDESPYLNLLPESAIAAGLGKAGYPANTPVTSLVAADVCRASGSKIYVLGALNRQKDGAGFTVDVEAVDCAGDGVAHEHVLAPDQRAVIDAVGKAASSLRRDLGEPARLLERFRTPLSQATSASLEALNQWSVGLVTWRAQGANAALSYLSAAVGVDADFAAATYDLGLAYRNAGEEGRARELFTQAFRLRQRATARKRFAIAAQYYAFVTVDEERAVAAFKEWIEDYPSDWKAVSNLGSFYGDVCRYQEAIAQFEQARSMNPDDFIAHEDLMEMLLATGQLEKVREAYQKMIGRKLDDDSPHLYLYVIGFFQNDPQEMAKQAAWFDGKADLRHEILSEEADAAAYRGHLRRARELSRQAVEEAAKADNKEEAASWLLNSAWREELFGNRDLAHDQAVRALGIAPDSREGGALAAIILARTGDISRAEALLRDIESRYRDHSVMQSYWLPCIRAQIALKRLDATAALKELERAAPLDTLYPQVFYYSHMPSVVLRAEAYRLAQRPTLAEKEWQTIVHHPGIVQLSPTAPIAKLELARAYSAATGADRASAVAKARTAYQDFLAMWQEGDADIPVLRAARRERSKLR